MNPTDPIIMPPTAETDPTLLDPEKPRSLAEWQAHVYAVAASRGWHSKPAALHDVWKFLGNIHGEITEAWEEARKKDFALARVYSGDNGKPEGLPVEFADIAIRILDTAQTFGLDVATPLATDLGEPIGQPLEAWCAAMHTQIAATDAALRPYAADHLWRILGDLHRVTSIAWDGANLFVRGSEDGKVALQRALGALLARVCDLSVEFGFDLATEMRRKSAYNAKRPWRHGDKRA